MLYVNLCQRGAEVQRDGTLISHQEREETVAACVNAIVAGVEAWMRADGPVQHECP